VPITPALLARLRSLDDLLELVAALGFAPRAEDLGPQARERLGLGGATDVVRAAILGRRGAFLVYGAVFGDAARPRVAQAIERLGRSTPGERNLLFALDATATTLAAAALAPGRNGARARVFRVALEHPSPVAAEILSRLAPRPDDTTLDLAVRCGDVLEEEGLTGRFFTEFAAHHARAADALREVPRATAAERRDLALIILTRVLFLYFVQAKGWLAGRSDFLPSLLDTALRRGHPFHHQVFLPLCFGALAAPLGARRGPARALDVPFLNGGLFERHALERRFPSGHLPNEAWAGLFDGLFQRFHFTVRERADADAVDPEMLGRVFEGLMQRDRRRAAGAYYTPRPLLRQAVAAALDAALEGAPVGAVRALRVLDPAVGSGAFLLEALAQLEARRAALWPDEDPRARRRAIVRDSLFGVDVDPMAVRLAELRLWLALVVDDASGWESVAPLPNLDQNLRQGDSLLSPLDFAREARLPDAGARLARVAEHRAAYFAATGRAKSDLARRIRAVERDLAADVTDAALVTLQARLADAAAQTGRDLFGRRHARGPVERARVAEWRRRRRELLALRRRLGTDDEALPFFAYDVHFGDILARGGFDVVLGNPPWVRGERLPATTRRLLAGRYEAWANGAERRAGFTHLPDLSVAFVERALELAREGGVIALLTPAKLLRAGYAGALRALLRRRAAVLQLDDYAHARESGFAATVFPLLLVARRGAGAPDVAARVTVVTAGGGVLRGAARQTELGLDEPPSRAPWLAFDGALVRAVRQALRAGPRLASRFRPRLGVKTGANAIFVRPRAREAELPHSARAFAVLGRDIAPFRVRASAVVLAAVDAAGAPCRDVSPEVATYLRAHAAALARRADAHGQPPWALFRTDLLRGAWLVLWRDIAPRLEAAALHRSPGGPVPLNSCYGVIVPDAFTAWWLAAYLNSAPVRAIARVLAERASGGACRFAAATVGALPIPAAPTPALRALAEIGQCAHEGGDWNDADLARHAAAALGLDAAVARRLVDLDAALRGDAERDR
jgi:hypothetical protein